MNGRYGFGFARDCRFDFCRVNIVSFGVNIHKNRLNPKLNHWFDSCDKRMRRSNDLIALT
jgi:hypothetical protein